MVKNENIAFLRDQLMPILPFTPKDFISAISDLPGHFCWCQNWFTKFSKIGGLCVSATVISTWFQWHYCTILTNCPQGVMHDVREHYQTVFTSQILPMTGTKNVHL
jgi:hypothetical protein